MTGIPYDWGEGLVVMLGVSALLILVIVLSVLKKIGIARETLIAMAKGGAQLFAIALFLTFLFDFDQWYFLIWLLLGTMVVVGGHTAAKRAGDMPRAFEVTTPAILMGAVVAVVVLVLSRAMPLHPHFIVPLTGMAFGNSMQICSLSMERLVREVRMNRQVIETGLSLGATSHQALEQYGRISVKASLIPTIDSLKTLGIIFIPGAMAGLLIAGTDPIVAAEYQIIVYLMIVGGGIISSLLAYYLSRPKLFTDAEQLQSWV